MQESALRPTDIARRLLKAFGPARFILFGALPSESQIMLNDAGGMCIERWDDADDETCLVCIGLDDEDLFAVLADAAARRLAGVYLEHRSSAAVPTSQALEARCFDLGYRKHPAYYNLFGYAGQVPGAAGFATLLEPINPAALLRFPLSQSSAACPHADMLRLAQSGADVQVARYDWASQFIRPNDTVLDATCGAGYGAYVMRHMSQGSRFVGVDADPQVIDYAKACYGGESIEFIAGVLTETLAHFDDASFDFVVAFDTLDRASDPAYLLAELRRVLRPGGRIVVCVPNDTSAAPSHDSHHSRGYTFHRLAREVSAEFLLERAARQTAYGRKRFDPAGEWIEGAHALEVIDHRAALEGMDAQWWLCTAMRSPLDGAQLPYTETVHDSFEGSTHLIDFAGNYRNPWLVHGMVEIPYRISDVAELSRLACETEQMPPPNCVDYGAALAVLGHQALASNASESRLNDIEQRIVRYLDLRSDNPHVARWKVSLAYVRARMKLRRGERESAIEAFGYVASSEVATITPTLGTKVVDAAYWAGLLNWMNGATIEARQCWKHGLDRAAALLGGDWLEFYGNSHAPLGFAMNDAVEIVDRAASCAHALSLTARPGPATRSRLQALNQQTLRSAVRELGNDLRASQQETAHVQKEIEALCRQLASGDEARRSLESLALARLDRIHALEQRLAETDAAFRHAESLAFERQKDRDVLETMALQRLDRIHALEQRLAETDAAYRYAEKLAIEREADLQRLKKCLPQ
jgi:SAM-dependent methyltransferase